MAKRRRVARRRRQARRQARRRDAASLERLPVEIVEAIADRLGLRDFKSLRLASPVVARVTRRLVAQPCFVAAPWRNDLLRLSFVTRQPAMVRRIRCVCIQYSPVVDDVDANQSSCRHHCSNPEACRDDCRAFRDCATRVRHLLAHAPVRHHG